LQGDRYTVAAVGVAGIEHVRPLIDGDNLVKLSEAQHTFSTGHHGRNVIRTRFETRLENVERFLQPAGLPEQGAAFLCRVPMRGLKIECVPKGQQRLVAPSLLAKRLSKAEQIFRLDRLLHRAGEPLHGVIVLSGIAQQQAHQMQAVSVSTIDLKRLLAAQLRVERPPRAPVINRRLIKRICRFGAASAGLCLGFARRGAAFVTIHSGRLAETSASNSFRTRSSTLA
jgi:hypothetical protein